MDHRRDARAEAPLLPARPGRRGSCLHHRGRESGGRGPRDRADRNHIGPRSQSPDKTDWSPLAGKECVILPDHDDPGGKYADTVAAILAKLTPAPVVKVVELPDLPDHGDIVDWIEAHGDARTDELAATSGSSGRSRGNSDSRNP